MTTAHGTTSWLSEATSQDQLQCSSGLISIKSSEIAWVRHEYHQSDMSYRVRRSLRRGLSRGPQTERQVSLPGGARPKSWRKSPSSTTGTEALSQCARKTHATSDNLESICSASRESTLLCQGHSLHSQSWKQKGYLVTKLCGPLARLAFTMQKIFAEDSREAYYWLSVVLSCADNQRESTVLSAPFTMAARNWTVST